MLLHLRCTTSEYYETYESRRLVYTITSLTGCGKGYSPGGVSRGTIGIMKLVGEDIALQYIIIPPPGRHKSDDRL